MKIFIFAALVVVYCVQALSGSPVAQNEQAPSPANFGVPTDSSGNFVLIGGDGSYPIQYSSGSASGGSSSSSGQSGSSYQFSSGSSSGQSSGSSTTGGWTSGQGTSTTGYTTSGSGPTTANYQTTGGYITSGSTGSVSTTTGYPPNTGGYLPYVPSGSGSTTTSTITGGSITSGSTGSVSTTTGYPPNTGGYLPYVPSGSGSTITSTTTGGSITSGSTGSVSTTTGYPPNTGGYLPYVPSGSGSTTTTTSTGGSPTGGSNSVTTINSDGSTTTTTTVVTSTGSTTSSTTGSTTSSTTGSTTGSITGSTTGSTTTSTTGSTTGSTTTGTCTQVNTDDINIDNIDVNTYEIQSGKIEIDDDCEKRFTAVTTDNENLKRKLQVSYGTISSLTDENTWNLKQLDKSKDDINCMTKDIRVLSTDIKVLTKKYQLSIEEITRLKTLGISSNSDLLACKANSDNVLIEYNKALALQVQNTNIINEYTTVISNLHHEITNIKTQINFCNTESGEWKRKYEAEAQNSASLTLQISSLQQTIIDLKFNNEKNSAALLSCQGDNHELDVKINGYKNQIATLNEDYSKITIESTNCQTSLAKLTKDFSDDQLSDLKKAALLEQTTFELKQCNANVNQLKIDYQSEKDRANGLGDQIIVIRGECQAKYDQYDIKINQVTVSFQGQLDKCQSDLQIERNTITTTNLQITTFQNTIVTLQNQVIEIKQTSHEWELKSQACDKASSTLSVTIEHLKQTITTINTQSESCVKNTQSVQVELNTCQATKLEYLNQFTVAQTKIDSLRVTIEGLNVNISQLTESNASCNNSYGRLRCSINRFLPTIIEAQNTARQLIANVAGPTTDSLKNLQIYVNTHDLQCPSCGSGGPCIQSAPDGAI